MDEQQDNPYKASAAPVIQRASDHPWHRVPSEISSPIKHMWILGLVVAAFTLAISLIPLATGYSIPPLVIALLLFEVAILVTLALFVRARSRIAATLLTVYYIGTKLLMMLLADNPLTGAVMSVLVAFVFVRGTIAVFRHHRFLREEAKRPPRLRVSDSPLFAQTPREDA